MNIRIPKEHYALLIGSVSKHADTCMGCVRVEVVVEDKNNAVAYLIATDTSILTVLRCPVISTETEVSACEINLRCDAFKRRTTCNRVDLTLFRDSELMLGSYPSWRSVIPDAVESSQIAFTLGRSDRSGYWVNTYNNRYDLKYLTLISKALSGSFYSKGGLTPAIHGSLSDDICCMLCPMEPKQWYLA